MERNKIELRINGDGDRTSFFKLFLQNNFRIVVPMLQREFAFGRESAVEKRKDFLDSLFLYLSENKPNRDLDFIYGNIVEDKFIPLDGQQRLTILFLLHWYLSRITENKEERKLFDEVLLNKNGHSRFTYETRRSSSDFCDALMHHTVEFKKLLYRKKEENGKEVKYESIAETIEDSNWFHLTWKQDPTISGMLNMLDSIHEIFKGHGEFFSRLINVDKPIITFLFLELKKYKLTDDLYIKMNSRGKQLTPFENFKARYSEYLEIENKKLPKKINLEYKLNDGTLRKLPIHNYFSEMIDNKWTNFIWEYRNEGDHGNMDLGQLTDARMSNLIAALISLKYLELNPVSKGEQDEVVKALIKKSNPHSLPFQLLKKENALIIPISIYVFKALDILSDNGKNPAEILDPSFRFYFNLNDILNKLIIGEEDFTYNDRVMLYAYLGFVMKYGYDSKINFWMRFIHNVANAENNSRIDSIVNLSNAIKSVAELLDVAPKINKKLCEGLKVNAFPKFLVEEERIKAMLLYRTDRVNWLESILETERHGYLTGEIGFILYFSGIYDYYNKNKNLNWDSDNNFIEDFKRYSQAARAIFSNSYENRVNDKDYVFERAVLSKGNYLPKKNSHHNLLSTSAVSNNVKRDYSWKTWLRVDEEESGNQLQLQLVKDVIDDKEFNVINLSNSLKKIFNRQSTGVQWRDFLIDYPGTIEDSTQGFIAFYDGGQLLSGVLPMNSSRLSGYHSEIYTSALYIELQDKDMNVFKEGMKYEYVKTTDELPHIEFKNMVIENKHFDMLITAETCPQEWSLKRFRVEFRRRGDRKNSPRINSLYEFLETERFKELDGDEKTLVKYVNSFDQAKKYISKLLKKFSEL